MEKETKEIKKPGNGHLFWGLIFTAMGFLSLFRDIMVVGGMPVWAFSFFLIAASNLLKAPVIRSILHLEKERSAAAGRIAAALNIMGMALLVITFIIGYYRS
ncbi:MAG: hypothetical protein JW746_02730 [Candidatus Krumholzibacteriota bacterium]|nr:hypothetical protein [Candidatus Krumholzibacteriota bacterium]